MPTAQLTMECNPIEVDGKWWVDVSLNNRKMKRRGPFPNADKAKAEADRIIREWTPALPATTNATVVLHGKPTELNSDLGRKFIVDAVRAAEGLQEDDELRAKYEISPSDLKKIAENTAVIAAIRDERARRVRNGQAAREAAQQRFIKSPAIMDAIMSDQQANPRHRIEASRELRATATGGGDESPAGASELFSIVFHLGADVERLEKVITPKPTPPVIEHNDSEGVVEEQGQ